VRLRSPRCKSLIERKLIDPDERIVCVMSGAGFKDATLAAESADRIGQQATTPFDVGAVVAQISP